MKQKTSINFTVDFMAIGAHPDDVEILAGGTVLKLISLGKRGVLVDMTRGEMGTRGDPKTRHREAQKSAKVLRVEQRLCLGLPDGGLKNGREEQTRLVEAIRKYRPKILLTHYWEDEHPDHRETSLIVKDSWYLSGLKNFEAAGEAYRPERIFYFLGSHYKEPDFCVDISDQWKAKQKALACFESQFFGKGSAKYSGKTDIASEAFMEFLEARFRFFGTRIKRKYAEPFLCSEIPEVHDLTDLGGQRF